MISFLEELLLEKKHQLNMQAMVRDSGLDKISELIIQKKMFVQVLLLYLVSILLKKLELEEEEID